MRRGGARTGRRARRPARAGCSRVCCRTGRPPTGSIGFGVRAVSARACALRPPAMMSTSGGCPPNGLGLIPAPAAARRPRHARRRCVAPRSRARAVTAEPYRGSQASCSSERVVLQDAALLLEEPGDVAVDRGQEGVAEAPARPRRSRRAFRRRAPGERRATPCGTPSARTSSRCERGRGRCARLPRGRRRRPRACTSAENGVDPLDEIRHGDQVQPRVGMAQLCDLLDAVRRGDVLDLLLAQRDLVRRPARLRARRRDQPVDLVTRCTVLEQRAPAPQRLVVGVCRDCENAHRLPPPLPCAGAAGAPH